MSSGKRWLLLSKRQKAPADLVDEIGDVSFEGGGVASALFDAWQNIQDDLKHADLGAGWVSAIEYYIHDAVIDIVDQFSNSMNYEPGAKKSQKRLDANALADAVAVAMEPKKSPAELKKRKSSDMSMLVSDVLDAAAKEGAISNVQWDRGATEIPYEVERSDYLETIDRIVSTIPDLNPVGAEENVGTYVDALTGLTVTFGDGTAIIK